MKKKISLSSLFISLVLIGFSQVPQAFNYQAVVRNSSGDEIANQLVSFRISLLQDSISGTPLYVETHSATTNGFGLVNLKIGGGTTVGGVFSPAGWGATSHFIKIEFDPAGGSSYSLMGISELLSVPYAFHAQTVGEDMVEDADADPANELQELQLSGTILGLSNSSKTVILPTGGDGGDNWGTQTVQSNATLSGDGTSGSPLGVVGDLTDNQTLSLSGDDLSISGGNTVTLPGDDWGTQTVESNATLSGDGTSGSPLGVVGDLTDDQTLSVSGSNLSISNGNTVLLPSSFWSYNNTSIYYNGGNVGIGVDNPASSLHIFSNEHSQIRVQSGAQDALLYLDKGNTSRFASVIFRDSNTPRFYIGLLTNNDFWISTSYISLNGMQILQGGDMILSDNLDIAGTIQIRGGGPLAGRVLSCNNQGLASWVDLDDNDWSISGNDIYSAVSGNVGIGNASPAYKLDVLGNRIRLMDGGGDWIAMRTDGSADFLDLTYAGGSLAVQGSAAGENIVLNPSMTNRVGIRTWVPVYDLDVNGDIRATGSVYYGGTAGNTNGTAYNKPDFVFTNDYHSLSTDEVAKFLQKENHLPWVTSAKKEKEENGNVTDMTRMAFETLEAIENLQLQIIELNNIVKEQGEIINQQTKEIAILKDRVLGLNKSR